MPGLDQLVGILSIDHGVLQSRGRGTGTGTNYGHTHCELDTALPEYGVRVRVGVRVRA